MIFQHTIEKVLSGEKTQTRRLIKGVNLALDIHSTPGATDSPNFGLLGPIQCVTTESGHLLYELGQVLAVQPGRGKPAAARIRINTIWREDVRNIKERDALADGFASYVDFLMLWTQMHDPLPTPQEAACTPMQWAFNLWTRPDALYQAWALSFELVRGGK